MIYKLMNNICNIGSMSSLKVGFISDDILFLVLIFQIFLNVTSGTIQCLLDLAQEVSFINGIINPN